MADGVPTTTLLTEKRLRGASRSLGLARPRWLPRVGAPERWLLVILAGWSLVPLVAVLVRVAVRGGVFPGVDGLFVSDIFQYLAFSRDSGDHIFTAPLYDLGPTSRVFLHPMFLISGLMWKLGLDLRIVWPLWKPLAVLVLFFGFWAYIDRLLPMKGWRRPAALALALFYAAPGALIAERSGVVDGFNRLGLQAMVHELFAAGFLWGTYPTALSVGLMPLVLLGTERLLDASRRGPGRSATTYALLTSVGGLIVSWLHPWQGACLVLMLCGVVLWSRLHRRNMALITPVVATVTPLIYYAALGRFDPTWAVESQIEFPPLPAWIPLISLAPLALPALFAMPGRSLDTQEQILRIWPAASLIAYLLIPNYPYHAFEAITLPLAILAVRYAAKLAPRAAIATAVASLTLPGVVLLKDFRGQLKLHQNAYYITASENEALDYLERARRPGGVFAAVYLGQTVPALTGRKSWVGLQWWTPDFFERARQSDDLFAGKLPYPLARRLVLASGADFLLSDCKARTDLRAALGNLVEVRHFGCATVYEVQRPSWTGDRTRRR